MPRVTLRYWASARAAAGVAEEQVDAPTVAAALESAAAAHGPQLRAVLGVASLLVDGARVPRGGEGLVLGEGAVVEVLPPFAGG